MISHRNGDLLEQTDLTHIAHQSNLCHVMGAGIAKAIADKWPRALEADKATAKGDKRKLGTFSFSTGKPVIINLYSQNQFGSGSTDYFAMKTALESLKERISPIPGAKLGLPYGMGCGLAGGNWSTVSKIIEDVFGQADFECVIVKLELASALGVGESTLKENGE